MCCFDTQYILYNDQIRICTPIYHYQYWRDGDREACCLAQTALKLPGSREAAEYWDS